jgi:hypothetical protein
MHLHTRHASFLGHAGNRRPAVGVGVENFDRVQGVEAVEAVVRGLKSDEVFVVADAAADDQPVSKRRCTGSAGKLNTAIRNNLMYSVEMNQMSNRKCS